MSDGQLIFSNAQPNPAGLTNAALNAAYTLLDKAQSGDAGVWVQMYPYSRGTLEVSNAAGGTFSVQLEGTNAELKPANDIDGLAMGSPVSANGLSVFTLPVRWIKAVATMTATYTVTVGGTRTNNDVLTLHFTGGGLAPDQDVHYTVNTATDTTLTLLATHITAAINANTGLAAANITASSVGAVITITAAGPNVIPVVINASANTVTETLTIVTSAPTVTASCNLSAP